MGIFSNRPGPAPDPDPPGGWFDQKPLPYRLTPLAEAALDEPEAEADV
jgi:hypothetical protein